MDKIIAAPVWLIIGIVCLPFALVMGACHLWDRAFNRLGGDREKPFAKAEGERVAPYLLRVSALCAMLAGLILALLAWLLSVNNS